MGTSSPMPAVKPHAPKKPAAHGATLKKAAPKKAAAAKKPSSAASAKAVKAAKAIVAPPATAPAALDDLPIDGLFPVDAVEKVSTPSSAGHVFRLDGGFLDALRLLFRRIEAKDGKEGASLEFKIAGPSRDDFQKRLEKKGAKLEPFEFFAAKVKGKAGAKVHARTGETQAISTSFYSHVAPNTSSDAGKALNLSGTHWKLEYIPETGPIALRGAIRLTLTGKPAEQNKALKEAIEKIGLQQVFAPTNDTALDRYALMRLLWHVAPAKAKELAGKGLLSDLKVDKVKSTLASLEISETRMDQLRYAEVAPGHFTVLDDAQVGLMKKAGLRYAYSTVTDPAHVLSILENGQKATLTRWSEGALISGMSSGADVGSGGAQGVFSRLVTTKAKDAYWPGRTYKIILKPELLARTDIWGWEGDYYGRSWDLAEKNFGPKLIEEIHKNGYSSYNEIISPVGNGPQYIAAVVATNEEDRKKLLAFLKKEGWKPAKGTLEQFVKLAPKIDPDLLD